MNTLLVVAALLAVVLVVRGRGRQLRDWAIWTPRRYTRITHALILLVGLGAAVGTVGLLRDDPPQVAATAQPTASSSPQASPTPTPSSSATPTPTATPPGPPATDQVLIDRSVLWTRAWLAGPDAESESAWRRAVLEHSVPALSFYLATVPNTAPARTTAVGTRVLTTTPFVAATLVTLADGTALRLELRNTGSGWLVSDYAPAAA